ncbi:hypothetical protein Emag_002533 [Eimeria magna]
MRSHAAAAAAAAAAIDAVVSVVAAAAATVSGVDDAAAHLLLLLLQFLSCDSGPRAAVRRLSRRVLVPLPDAETRAEIIRYSLRKVLDSQTPGGCQLQAEHACKR